MVNSFVLASILPKSLHWKTVMNQFVFIGYVSCHFSTLGTHLPLDLFSMTSVPFLTLLLPIILLDTLLSARRQSFHDTMMIPIAHTMNYLFIHQKDFISFLISIQTLYQVWLDLLMMFCLPFSEVGNCFLPLDLIGAWLDGV